MLLVSSFANAQNKEKAILILDASGSMWGEVDGQTKIDVAKQVVIELINSWNYQIDLGLMVYGHRSKSDCADIELLIPPGPVNAALFREKVSAILPRGKTPLTRSVIMAAEFLRYTEEKATVILVSDGIETCNEDPCAAADTLAATGINFKAHVIGFALKPQEQAAIDCLSRKTGGLSLTAKNAAELKNALAAVAKATVEATPPPPPPPAPPPPPPPPPSDGKFVVKITPVLFKGGDPVDALVMISKADGSGGKGRELARGVGVRDYRLTPGSYTARVQWGAANVPCEFEVPEGKGLEVEVVLGAGIARITAIPAEGQEPLKNGLYYYITSPEKDQNGRGKEILTGGGPDFKLPAGKYSLKVNWGPHVSATSEFSIEAGEVSEVTINLNAGVLQISAHAAEGGEVLKDHFIHSIYGTKTDLSGKRKVIAESGATSYQLPAGEVIIETRWGTAAATNKVVIKAGEISEVNVNLNAGMLQISARAAEGGDVLKDYYIHSIYGTKTDLSGKRKMLAESGASTYRLSAGEVIIESRWGYANSKNKAVVKAGESVAVDVIFNAGILELSAVEGAVGGKPVKGLFEIFSSTKDLEGKRKLIASTGASTFRLNAGSYFVQMTYQGRKGTAEEVEVKAGQSQSAILVIPLK